MPDDDAQSTRHAATNLMSQAHTQRARESPAVARLWRRAGYTATYLSALGSAMLAADGLRSSAGRQLLWGKLRRLAICCVPGLARHLQGHHGLRGGCTGCGASCNLMLRCPHWNPDNGRCNIYAERPATCRTFPITPADLDDLRLARSATPCGYHFASRTLPTATDSVPDSGA